MCWYDCRSSERMNPLMTIRGRACPGQRFAKGPYEGSVIRRRGRRFSKLGFSLWTGRLQRISQICERQAFAARDGSDDARPCMICRSLAMVLRGSGSLRFRWFHLSAEIVGTRGEMSERSRKGVLSIDDLVRVGPRYREECPRGSEVGGRSRKGRVV